MTNQKTDNITLLKGDCLILMKDLPSKSVDLILCDPPYGITSRNKWDEVIPFEPMWEEYRRIIKNNGAIVLFANGLFTANLMISASDLWKYNLVWEKTQPSGFLNANKMPLRNHEDICVFYKHQPKYNPQKTYGHERKVSTVKHQLNSNSQKDSLNYGVCHASSYDSTERFPLSVITFPKDTQKSAIHPTQKPVALLEYLIRTYTDEGDMVLDNCMGSGSTGIACINTNRGFIGMEKSDHYFNAAKKRIEECQQEIRLF